ncbi:MAG: ABC transporter permease [Lachnospiraceae bacterium]|nr:ABC transporter permease [Lachnospiraceae bacterium]
MKEFCKNVWGRCRQVSLTDRQRRWWILALVCLCLAGGLSAISSVIQKRLPSQQMVQRWDAEGGSAQISCFFADGSDVVPNTIRAFEYTLSNQLKEASIKAPKESARLWVDAYSAKGKITLASNRTSVQVGAYGVGGDYFLFHPLQLEQGSMYFDGDDLMQDQVILDQNTAWQLFGSYDIAGQPITIGTGPMAHIGVVAGVIESENGWMNEQAGAAAGTVYLSYEMLDRYGTHSGINAYEIVMPDPIRGFARGMVADHIGFSEDQIQIVENSSRYSFVSLWKILGQFGTRSMNTKAIIYPYWENAARGWEDVLSLLLLIQMLLLIQPAVLLIVVLWRLWKCHRPRWSDLRDWLQRHREAQWARQAAKHADKSTMTQ